jgi:hypothetical protein
MDERNLPTLRDLGELEEEALRLSAVNMNGVVLSVGCFVSLHWWVEERGNRPG